MAQVYGSDPVAYDLEAAFAAPSKPRTFLDTLDLVQLNGKSEPLPAPTHGALARREHRKLEIEATG